MKDGLHDALWNAHQRCMALLTRGETKFGLKMAGLRDAKNPNHYTRGLIFTGRTRTTYERDLREFLKYSHERFGVQHLRDITVGHARAYLERAIDQGWKAKTLHKLRSELVKLAATALHKTASFVALSKEYGRIIRGLVASQVLAGPSRETPSAEVVAKAVEILRGRDERYYLAARLQLETGGRSVSCTDRIIAGSLKDGNVIELIGKGGKVQSFVISGELRDRLSAHLAAHPGPFADRDAYREAWRRAMRAAGGHVAGSHGLRRRSTQDHCSQRFHERRRRGETPRQAREGARKDAVERLGHGRDRRDQAMRILGRLPASPGLVISSLFMNL